jgi:ubiquitin-like modifier-activating enzyme ATG7
MPDHPNSFVESDYNTLLHTIDWADVIFLLVDTREARWFPTLASVATEKLVINAAVGFESFVVMRHGLPSQSPSERLGCYFCSDIVSPQNVIQFRFEANVQSTDNATLDQQCTVTRPGVAPITASLAVELYVTLLQHELRGSAPAPSSKLEGENSFGTCVHQIRGHLSTWEQTCLTGLASPYCVGCGDNMVKEFKKTGIDFIKRVCERGGSKLIETVSGLEQVKKEFEDGWDGDEDGDGAEWEL